MEEIRAYRKEFLDNNDSLDGCSGLEDYEDIVKWIELCRLTQKEETKPNPDWVTADTYMLVNQGENRILGMINFRHELSANLAERGGHIGYSVRPNERQKGYAKLMLSLCLDFCKNRGLERVLVTCNDDNIGSIRTIEHCGGVFERSGIQDGVTYLRYWIALQ